LRELEHRFPNELAIVGVHAGKYTAERVTERIREAAIRLGNTHPIVNDRQFRIWRGFAVNAWPTLVAIDPRGRVAAMHAGEFTADAIGMIVQQLIEAHDPLGEIDRTPLHFVPDNPAIEPRTLRYPGKVETEGHRIAVADTGHHRVLVGRLARSGKAMQVNWSVGSGSSGFVDSIDPATASFNAPQGMAFDGDRLYVADTGNHAVRAIDLQTGAVRTVAGAGKQLRTRADREAGALSSPWDIALDGRVLFIAMAGIHQIWTLDLVTRTLRVHCGSRREDIIDGPHAEAALAQPMGILVDADHRSGARVYFCDAESSAVRWADANPSGRVGTVAGTGLFDFGDRDGIADDARLQHQQGLTMHPSGRLLVADSYNDALRWVDAERRAVTTWVRGFHEPGGIAYAKGLIYVADTNAHCINVVDEEGDVTELEIETVAPVT
jgi:DNA-binding beta-propeller fold protein YncE